MGWAIYLVWDIAQTRSVRSVFELVLLAALVYWPIVRTRIRFGYWMRDWDDDRRVTPATDQPAARSARPRTDQLLSAPGSAPPER